jgi:hypothetical protein
VAVFVLLGLREISVEGKLQRAAGQRFIVGEQSRRKKAYKSRAQNYSAD